MLTFSIVCHNQPGSVNEVPRPEIGPNDVLVNVKACGLNFADLLMTQGRYQDTPQLPFTPGLECAGAIVAVGENISDLKINDRVAVFAGKDGLQQFSAFDRSMVTPLPDGVTFEQAAAIQIAYGTSLMALDTLARLQPGETLLVTGAAGGVGLTAVEIGKLLGARVIAHARGADKLAVAKAAGADELIDDSEDLRSRVKELGGADVVYDAIGGEVWKAAFRATNPGGRLLPIGFAGGEVPQIPANHLLVKNLTVIGFYFGGYRTFAPDLLQAVLNKVLAWCDAGKIHPHISHKLPLSQVQEGLDLLKSRKSTGKVVITLDD